MRLNRGLVVVGAAVIVTLAPGAAPSQAREGRPDVVVNVIALKQVTQRDAAGHESVALKEADATGPGDTLVYRIVCTNKGTAAAHDAQIVDPIPSGTQLIPGSWESGGAEFTVSIDGGRTFVPYPAQRPARQADGSSVMKDVPLSAYTHVRWTSREPLPPAGSRSAEFKVLVL